MKKIKALIHLTSENSVDHLSPLIWYLIKNNHKVLIYFLKDYQYEKDYRINIFKKYKNFHIMNRQEYFENFFNFLQWWFTKLQLRRNLLMDFFFEIV